MKKQKIYFDNEEREIVEAYERGDLVPIKMNGKEREWLRQIARNTLKKNKNINLRMSERGIVLLKRKAAEKGLPYQTLASSVLYQYGSDKLVEKN